MSVRPGSPSDSLHVSPAYHVAGPLCVRCSRRASAAAYLHGAGTGVSESVQHGGPHGKRRIPAALPQDSKDRIKQIVQGAYKEEHTLTERQPNSSVLLPLPQDTFCVRLPINERAQLVFVTNQDILKNHV